jgi:hypothetical protein
MAKKAAGSNPSPKKAPSSPPAKSSDRAKKSTLEKFRAMDRSSMTSLILSKVANAPEGISADDLTADLVNDVKDSVKYHLQKLQAKKTIVAMDNGLAISSGRNKYRTLVCLAFCHPPGAIDEKEVICRVQRWAKDADPVFICGVLEDLRSGSDCVTYKDGLYSRDCTVDCSCS